MTVKDRTYLMTNDRVAAAGEGLLRLSKDCDGAAALDYQGFNKFHAASDFVRDLVGAADSERGLSDKQAAWALEILRIYSNTQLEDLAPRLWPETEG